MKELMILIVSWTSCMPGTTPSTGKCIDTTVTSSPNYPVTRENCEDQGERAVILQNLKPKPDNVFNLKVTCKVKETSL